MSVCAYIIVHFIAGDAVTCSAGSVCTARVNAKKKTAASFGAHSQLSTKRNGTTTTDSHDSNDFNGSFFYGFMSVFVQLCSMQECCVYMCVCVCLHIHTCVYLFLNCALLARDAVACSTGSLSTARVNTKKTTTTGCGARLQLSNREKGHSTGSHALSAADSSDSENIRGWFIFACCVCVCVMCMCV